MWDVVVVGGINTDYLIRGERLPVPGQSLEGETFFAGPGGKGANQAVAVARLGARVTMIGRVGPDDRGDFMIAALKREGVDTTYIERDAHVTTGAAVIMVDRSGEKTIMAYPGVNFEVRPAHIHQAAAAIRESRVLLTQLELPTPAIEEALMIARGSGVHTILDPAPARHLAASFLKLVDVIRPNSTEAEALSGIPVHDRESARKAAAFLMKEGVGAACVQAGDEGDLMVWKGGELLLPRIPVERVDATGAGDAFAAGLAVGLAKGQTLEDAGRIGNAAAALATTKLGAQSGLPNWDEVQALLKERQ